MTCPIHPDADKEIGWVAQPASAEPKPAAERPSDAEVEEVVTQVAYFWLEDGKTKSADVVRRLLAYTKRLESTLESERDADAHMGRDPGLVKQLRERAEAFARACEQLTRDKQTLQDELAALRGGK
jgi:hypothetical protein